MEGRKLLEELKRTVDALQIFSEIGKALTSTLEIKEVLRIVLQKISELLQPTSWSLLLMEKDEEQLRYEILINEPSVDRSRKIPLGEEVPGWVAKERRPILWPDPTADRRFTPPTDILPGPTVKSLLAVPLKSKEKLLGVIEIRRKGHDVIPFGEEDLTTLSVIADYASIGLENARNFQRIQELTITDDLTSLYNVRHLHKLLDSEVMRSSRYRKNFSMIFLDLDHFKNVNDTHGHIHGSKLLRETAEVLKEQIRTVDFAARYGGDEFVILLPETGKSDAIMIAERIRSAVEKNIFLESEGLHVQFTASFGVATFPDDAQSKEDLIKLADEAMYKVKNSTRNRVEAA